jgi:hypothetical protein
MANIAVELLQSIVELTVSFGEIALMSPLQFLLLAVGGALTLLSVAGFGYLVFGAALEPLGVDLPSPGRRGPER